MDPVVALGALVQQAASAVLGIEHVDPQVRRSEHADLQSDVALGLARAAKQAPRVLAQRLVDALPANDLVDEIAIAGPGFINVTVRASWLAAAANAVHGDDRLGVPRVERPHRVVIDYASPNFAKEMHVGHLRSTILGDSLARTLAWLGHTVIRQNHLGDWGTPFGMLIEQLLDQDVDQTQRQLALGELAGFYRAANRRYEAEPAFAERARRRVVLLQSGDADTLGWWRQLIAATTACMQTIFDTLGVTMTPADTCAESFYNDRLPVLVDELLATGRAVISDGAVCLFPPGFAGRTGAPLPLMLRKRDGGYGYGTTDLAAIRYRVDELGATRILYVVGASQTQHLAMVVAAASELGWLTADHRALHVPFGLVLGTDGQKLASREGNTFRLIDLLERAIERADRELVARAPELAPEARQALARAVGVGAVKYADLSCDRIKDYVFDLDRMVSFEGDTAGYLQYAHARIRSVLRRAEQPVPAGSIQITDRAERALALTLLRFGSVVHAVGDLDADIARTLQPHRLAGYLHDLAVAFTKFYDACPILTAGSDALRDSRLGLADLTGRTLATGLDLLGIAAPDRM